jgi:hypothetical protein
MIRKPKQAHTPARNWGVGLVLMGVYPVMGQAGAQRITSLMGAVCRAKPDTDHHTAKKPIAQTITDCADFTDFRFDIPVFFIRVHPSNPCYPRAGFTAEDRSG